MDWRDVRAHGTDRGAAFYRTVLEYGNYLWQHGRAARALLCLDRALGADLAAADGWPLPYAALAWVLAHAPPEAFLGNPRIHYQHLAWRMNPPRREQRRWRAWACWAITRRLRPELPGDPRQPGTEPAPAHIEDQLRTLGMPGEADLWRGVLDRSVPKPIGES